jgi:hypothetical protein
MIVDRTSWITRPNDETSIIYELDPKISVPRYVYDKIFFSFYTMIDINWFHKEIHLAVRV